MRTTALALDTILATPDGWCTVADVTPGTRLLGADGYSHQVQQTAWQLQGLQPSACYEVAFANGERVTAGASHCWKTFDGHFYTDQLAHVLPKSMPLAVPLIGGHPLPGTKDPYLQGADSAFNADVIGVIVQRASRADRLAFVQGLMDAKGSITRDGLVCAYHAKSRAEARSVISLLATLGIRCSPLLTAPGIDEDFLSHRVRFSTFANLVPVFRDPNKLGRMRRQLRNPAPTKLDRVIVKSVTKVPPVPLKSIEPAGFLFGETMLPA